MDKATNEGAGLVQAYIDSMINKCMKKTICYKLTDQNMQTYKGFQWEMNKWVETSGEGELCDKGWLHAYSHPLVALLMNPMHADIKTPRLFKAEGAGEYKDDNGCKCGYSKLRLIEELKVPEITVKMKIIFAILCVKKVYKCNTWNKWADNWLKNIDRTSAAASSAAASNAAYAAFAAAYAFAACAAFAAAYAASNAAFAAFAASAAFAAAYAAYAASNAFAAAAAFAAAKRKIDLISIAKKAQKLDKEET